MIKKPLYYKIIKRLFDILFSSVVIIVGFIPSLIIAAIIFFKDRKNPFYTEKRIVQGYKEINVVKFRTMVADAYNFDKYFNKRQKEQWEREHKVDNDPRITKIGKFLRAISIDEFPQFLQVWIGNLSTIGPRVITKKELECFGDNKDLLLSMKPGITGLWQTTVRNEAKFQDGSRQKIELDYINRACIKLDLKIFFKTINVMLFKENV